MIPLVSLADVPRNNDSGGGSGALVIILVTVAVVAVAGLLVWYLKSRR